MVQRPFRRPAGAALIVLLLAASPAAAQERARAWELLAGLGAAVDLHGMEGNDAAALGLGAHLALTGRVADGLRLGVQWDAAWFGGAPADEERHQLALVWEWTSDDLLVRVGPGLGLATVVEVDAPDPGGPPGDALVTIGSEGAVGLTAGVGLRIEAGRRLVVEPAVDLVAQRAAGHTLATLVVGGRLHFRRRIRG